MRFATRIPTASAKGSPAREPLTVVTPHAHAAGMVLDRIDRAFGPLLNTELRYDIFERIVNAVTEYLAFIPSAQDTAPNLLRVMVREARDILEEMDSGEFPYVPEKTP